MQSIFIALKLLWRRKLTNAILVFEIILSIIMLAQLFVFITNHLDNIRAMNELPVQNTSVLNIFTYYDTDDVIMKIESDESIESVGRVYTGAVSCENRICNLAVYSDAIVTYYRPSLSTGMWFSDIPEQTTPIKQAVISRSLGYDIGETITIRMDDQQTEIVQVIGILKEPTQYLFPNGGASPQHFSANLIISQDPVVMIQEKDCNVLPTSYIPKESGISENVFVFFNPEAPDEAIDATMARYGKYGEFSRMNLLIDNFNNKSYIMVWGGLLFFLVFFLLAITSTLSMNIIQQIDNQKRFTVYYLLGMNRRQMRVIEITRILLLELIVMGLTILAGRCGLLMLEWMTAARIGLFYGLTFLISILMFTSVSAGFWKVMTQNDITDSLKKLQYGE